MGSSGQPPEYWESEVGLGASALLAKEIHGACTQAVWVASLAVAAPVVLWQPWMAIPSAHVEILAGAAAVGSVCAELFMIKSLLVFDPKVAGDGHAAADEHDPKSPRYKQSKVRGPVGRMWVCPC